MSEEIKREQWAAFFNTFSKVNQARPTRLEIFGELGAQEEERHLPLNGVSLEDVGEGAPKLEILLGGQPPGDARHLTHTVTRVQYVAAKVGQDGRDEALEIQDAEGTKTLLCFESPAELHA